MTTRICLLHDKPACQMTSRLVMSRSGEYGEWGQDIRNGFDAFLAGNHDAALVYYEIAAELGYEVAMVRSATHPRLCV